MGKSLKYFRMHFGNNDRDMKSNQSSHSVYKYSMYMQSKDSAWIDRNVKDDDDVVEPIEEDIRD